MEPPIPSRAHPGPRAGEANAIAIVVVVGALVTLVALVVLFAVPVRTSTSATGPGGPVTVGTGQGNPSGDHGLAIVDPEDPARPYYHRFGELPFGVKREHAFRLRNRDGRPVTLMDVQEACQCVRVVGLRLVEGEGAPREGDLGREGSLLVIPPDGVAEVVTRVDTGLIGQQEANKDKLSLVRLRSDSTTPYLTLELSFLTRRLFLMNTPQINLHDVGQGAGKGGEVTILTGLPDSPARLVEVVETPEGLEATLEERFDGGEHYWRLLVELEPMRPLGAFRGTVWLSTTDALGEGEQGRLEVPVLAQVVEDVRIYPEGLSFGLVNQGRERELEASLQVLMPGHSVRIAGVDVTGPSAEHVTARFEPRTQLDEQGRAVMWNLTLVCDADHPPGKVEATLGVDLDDAQFPRLERAVQGVVR